jgi:ribosomal protein S18 acetylase RimI-like enzyme
VSTCGPGMWPTGACSLMTTSTGCAPKTAWPTTPFGDAHPDGPTTLVAVVDATMCGFVSIGPSRDEDAAGAGQVYALYVDPQAWGRGIGRALITQARTRLSRRGFAEAVLWVHADNDRAHRFYRADGWQPDGHQRQEYVWGVLADEVRYHRWLP